MSGFSLRPARSTDAGKAAAVMSEFTENTPWLPRLHSQAQDIAFVAEMIDRGWVHVAMQGHMLAGFLARHHHDIHALYVANALWGKGCGSALLQEAQRQVSHLSLWTFQANSRAQTFYRNHGFVEKERTTGAGNDENLPDIRFEWHKEGTK